MKMLVLCVIFWISGGLVYSQQTPQPSNQAEAPTRLKTEDLHPAFILTPEKVKQAISLGEETFRKNRKIESIINKYQQKPLWTRGKRGRAHESRVLFVDMAGLPITVTAYKKASLYEKADFTSLLQNGKILESIRFWINLGSIPKVAANIFQDNRDADEKDVKALKFVLTDDKGSIIVANSGSTDTNLESGEMTFNWRSVVPEFSRSTTNSSASGSVTGSGGSIFGSIVGRSTTSSYRYSIQQFNAELPYYVARYEVTFSLFDKEGNPNISKDATEITLRIITESGELNSTYKISPSKKR